MTKLEDLKRTYKKLVWRLPHHTWSETRIQEEINKKSSETIKEVIPPAIDPVTETSPPAGTDPLILKLLAWQQEMMGKQQDTMDKIVEQLDEMKANRPLSEDEAKAEFNESLKNTHFENSYTYEIYALKHKLPDWSEERGLTGKRFNTTDEANEYWMKEFWSWKFKLNSIKKPKLVENN